MDGATIRPARIEECPLVLDLWRRAGAIPSPTDTIEDLQRLVTQLPGRLLVAESDGVVVGTVIAGWDGWRGTIYRLAVLPEHRRRGIAAALVRDAARRLGAAGAKRLSILVERHDEQALAFWDSLAAQGYERDPRMLRFIKGL
jgi:ribosomal protein S18 acetylase RimI-like enzyme